MIRYALLTCDEAGRSDVSSRVLEVDRTDGLDPVSRVNAGIDLMLGAARAEGRKVGVIGVATRAETRRKGWSAGTGPRRQIHAVTDEEAVLIYLSGSGRIDRYGAVVVADCGDTGMSLYTVEPATRRVHDRRRVPVPAGRLLDAQIADYVAGSDASIGPWIADRYGRDVLIGACRTAKEEAAPATSTGGSATLTLSADQLDEVARPMIAEARATVAEYLADLRAVGTTPEALVAVGGLANLPAIREIGAGLEVIVPPTPELAAATGAAIAARSADAPTALTFIGGRRGRGRLSVLPAAVAVALVCGVALAAAALGATLTGGGPPPAPSNPVTESTVDASTTVPRDTAASSPVRRRTTRSSEPPAVVAPIPDPGWATTELPQTTSNTTTLTLSPPEDQTPWPWPIPPEFLPPALRSSITMPSLSPSASTDAPSTTPTESTTPDPTPNSDHASEVQTPDAPTEVPLTEVPLTEVPLTTESESDSGDTGDGLG
ncbi:MAG: hypothetical protein QM662_00645 [Gordonia sp. (in: high G+C Gram-positive bacteria)]